MNPVLIRRLAVVAVCVVGVAAIYLWPTRANSPLGGPQSPAATSAPVAPTGAPSTPLPTGTPPPPPPPPPPSGTGPGPGEEATPYDPNKRVDTHAPTSPTAPGSTSSEPAPPPGSSTSPPSSGPGSTAAPPTPGSPTPPPSSPGTGSPSGSPTGGTASPTPGDTTPPYAPTGLREENKTNESLTVAWNPSTDVGGGPVVYQVYMDGAPMLDQPTTEVTATVRWLIDDTHHDGHRVWVRAIDRALLHADSEPIVVERPEGQTDPSAGPPPPPPTNSSTSASRAPARPPSSGDAPR